MRNPNVSLSIYAPCSENWNSMTTTRQGKYCDKCAKQVIDFSFMTDQQILNYLQKKEGRMCGRLNINQMNRQLISNPPSSRFSGFLKFLVSGIFLTQIEMAASQTHVVYRYERQFREDEGIQPADPNTVDQPSLRDVSKNQIRGLVVDSSSGEPLIFANVVLLHPFSGTQTDFEGRFVLTVPENYKEDSIKIEVSYIGYRSKEIIIPRLNFKRNQNLNIPLEGGIMLGGVTVGAISVRYPWWKFWKRIRF